MAGAALSTHTAQGKGASVSLTTQGAPEKGNRGKATNVSPGQGCNKERAPSGRL